MASDQRAGRNRRRSKQKRSLVAAPVQPPDKASATPAASSDSYLAWRTKHNLRDVCGVKTEAFAEQVLAQVVVLQVKLWNQTVHLDPIESALGLLQDIGPKTPLEALLAVQMIGVQQAATMFLTQATREEQSFVGRDANVLRATRLMRLFMEQLEALAKLRGTAGQQKVTVEHVHVHDGGRAIVGAVTASPNPTTTPGVVGSDGRS